MAMQWRPAPPALIDRFGAILPSDARVERRKMFGYPCAFVGGNMFTGLFEERMILRLPDAARAEFLALPGAEGFAPMGRPMRQYVVVPPEVLADTARVKAWLGRSLAYAATLPSKAKKSKAPKKRKTPKSAKAAPRKTAARKSAKKASAISRAKTRRKG